MSILSPTLSYCEDSMPGDSSSERLELASQYGLALEIANRGQLLIEPYHQAKVQISAVQAYGMHDCHPLHLDPERRSQARPHVLETLEIAAQLNAPRIVTVCGFGHHLVDQPLERCLDFFASCASRAKDLGIWIMIEPLSPKRCGAMTDPQGVSQLITTLNEPEVFSLMLDTGHLLDSGIELNSFFQDWQEPIEELQLKGLNSTAPGPEMPWQDWINALPTPPAIISIEHRQAIASQAFPRLIKALKQTLNDLNQTNQ